MAGKHRYEPEVHRASWVPPEADADPSRVEHLNTGLTIMPSPKRKPWWSRLRRSTTS